MKKKESVLLINSDCITALKDIPSQSVDLILTDPPYNLGLFMQNRDTNLKKMRDNFFVAADWDIDGKEYSFEQLEFKQSALRPDTIMITDKGKENQKTFVLDSKYYRYGESKQLNHLPMSGSIIKQIAYAEYIENKENQGKLKQSKSIHNAFIMPFESKNSSINMKFVGSAYTDYKTGDKPYYKIKTILIDTKWLMENHNRNNKMIADLAELIERGKQ